MRREGKEVRRWAQARMLLVMKNWSRQQPLAWTLAPVGESSVPQSGGKRVPVTGLLCGLGMAAVCRLT